MKLALAAGDAAPADPHRGVKVFADYTSSAARAELRLEADVVVVGSGPGGAVVAKELAEGGLDVIGGRGHLVPVIGRLADAGIRVSLFIDPDPDPAARVAYSRREFPTL